MFGELRSADPDFKRENSIIAIENIAKKEQQKFVGLKKDDGVEFDIAKVFSDPEFTAQLLGVSPDEAKSANGRYIFKVNTISRTEPAELNQELFDRVFGKDSVKTEEEFTTKIKDTIGENYKRESDHFFEHHIEDYYVEHTEINLPDNFLKAWLKTSSKGEVTDDVLETEFDHYKRGLKWDLVKNRIAEDHKITVEPMK